MVHPVADEIANCATVISLGAQLLRRGGVRLPVEDEEEILDALVVHAARLAALVRRVEVVATPVIDLRSDPAGARRTP